jgi:hypothetical protein
MIIIGSILKMMTEKAFDHFHTTVTRSVQTCIFIPSTIFKNRKSIHQGFLVFERSTVFL